MVIAVNTRFLIPGRMEGIGWFTMEVMRRMVHDHPHDKFYFLFDRKASPEFIFGSNVVPVELFPPARHPLLWHVYFQHSVSRALAEINPSVFLSPDGFLSLNTQVPTVMVIHDLAFEHYPYHVPFLASWYYRYFTPKFARKADKIITVSEFSKKDIAERYLVQESRIEVAFNGCDDDRFIPVNDQTRQRIRQKLTGGKPYFLFVSSLQPRKNLVRILRAYDEFRRNGGEETFLVLGKHTWIRKEIESVHRQMRFRDDVIFAGHLSREALVEANQAATALVYASLFEGFGIPIIEAMRCGTPVITSDRSSMPEVAGGAAILVNPESIPEISAGMTEISTDKQLRSDLIEAGLRNAGRFTWQEATDKVWHVIKSVCNSH